MPPVNPIPVMVTTVPPDNGPLLGVMADMPNCSAGSGLFTQDVRKSKWIRQRTANVFLSILFPMYWINGLKIQEVKNVGNEHLDMSYHSVVWNKSKILMIPQNFLEQIKILSWSWPARKEVRFFHAHPCRFKNCFPTFRQSENFSNFKRLSKFIIISYHPKSPEINIKLAQNWPNPYWAH